MEKTAKARGIRDAAQKRKPYRKASHRKGRLETSKSKLKKVTCPVKACKAEVINLKRHLLVDRLRMLCSLSERGDATFDQSEAQHGATTPTSPRTQSRQIQRKRKLKRKTD